MTPESRTAQAPASSQIVPTGQWQFDPHRSTIGFSVKKMGLYHVKGRFRRFTGTVTSRPGALRAEITIAAASVHTRIPPRDAHLRSGQFLHVKQHPGSRVMRDAFELAGGGEMVVRGMIEIRGTERPLELRAHAHVTHPGQGAGEVVRLHLQGTLDRHEFGVRPPQPFEMIVGGEVQLDAELLLEPAGA